MTSQLKQKDKDQQTSLFIRLTDKGILPFGCGEKRRLDASLTIYLCNHMIE